MKGIKTERRHSSSYHFCPRTTPLSEGIKTVLHRTVRVTFVRGMPQFWRGLRLRVKLQRSLQWVHGLPRSRRGLRRTLYCVECGVPAHGLPRHRRGLRRHAFSLVVNVLRPRTTPVLEGIKTALRYSGPFSGQSANYPGFEGD